MKMLYFGMSVTWLIQVVKDSLFHTCSALCEDVISKTRQVLTNMGVDSERCLENIKSQRGLVMAEKVMIELVEYGIPRDEAHEILRSASFEAVDKKNRTNRCKRRTPEIAAAFSAEELEAMFDPMNHIGVSVKSSTKQ